MSEHLLPTSDAPERCQKRDISPESARTSGNPVAYNRYKKRIDSLRKVDAIAFALFGIGFAICARQEHYLAWTLGWDPGGWLFARWAFEIGALACLLATFVLILESLIRPNGPEIPTLRRFVSRSTLIVIVTGVIYYLMATAYGHGQAIGSVITALLLLATVQERHKSRVVLSILTAIAFGLTLWGTQSSYQYASNHAEEIVAAACQLADRCPRSSYQNYSGFHSSAGELFGKEIDLIDSRVPDPLRRLGAQRIWVDDEAVSVYVGGDTEYIIYRSPHNTGMRNPVWVFRGKGCTQFTDQLWSTDY